MNFLGGDVNDADSENWFKFRRADLIPRTERRRRAPPCSIMRRPGEAALSNTQGAEAGEGAGIRLPLPGGGGRCLCNGVSERLGRCHGHGILNIAQSKCRKLNKLELVKKHGSGSSLGGLRFRLPGGANAWSRNCAARGKI